MCRLFGFRSVIQSQVHRSLMEADNAIGGLSELHPDGWGVAYYVDDAPHLTRSPRQALSDQIFHKLSGVVASETVVAHVRKATSGDVNVLNCHPFQHGRWVFAHNGDVVGFKECRPALLSEVAPRLRRYILGDTDSEVLFYLTLSQLLRHGELSQRFDLPELVAALSGAIRIVRDICDDGVRTGFEGRTDSLLTCLLTDGRCMVALQGGKELFWSTYKTRCADRESCASLSRECEAPTEGGFVNHLIFSSTPLSGENIWNEMARDEVVGVDWRMRLHQGSLGRRLLSVAQ